MLKLNSRVSDELEFYMGINPYELINKYGSPLYVYNEKILRYRMKELKGLISYENFQVNYSMKANSNLAILQIAKEEGLLVDAMSTGEIFLGLEAGFSPEQIFYIPNNVSEEEMQYALDRNVLISVDSISQLETLGKINRSGKVAIRFNGGIGAGHHEKVITAGEKTKFGVTPEYIQEVKNIIERYDLKLVGINQHIGSLFMDYEVYIKGISSLFAIARQFEDLDFIDIGGGFGIPYHKQNDEKRLDLSALGKELDHLIANFVKDYGKKIKIKIEPGRYIPAESSILLGTVHATKYNGKTKYIGTDLGFNVLIRPMLYDSYHEIEVYREIGEASKKDELVTVVGNICETGDIIAKDRLLPEIFNGDILGVLDAGSYGHVMSSNYNSRLRPAEVLIRENGTVVLIRERDTLEDLIRHYKKL